MQRETGMHMILISSVETFSPFLPALASYWLLTGDFTLVYYILRG